MTCTDSFDLLFGISRLKPEKTSYFSLEHESKAATKNSTSASSNLVIPGLYEYSNTYTLRFWTFLTLPLDVGLQTPEKILIR